MSGVVEDPDGSANVRARPSLDAKIIGAAKNGERVQIEAVLPQWVRVIRDGHTGFIHKSRVRIEQE